MQPQEISRRTLRLPQDAADFVAAEAQRNLTSENAEIVRAIRAAMKAKGPAATAIAPDHEPTNP